MSTMATGEPEGGARPVAKRRPRVVPPAPAKPRTLEDRARLAEVHERAARGQATADDVAFLLYLNKELATRLATVGKVRSHLRNTLTFLVGREAYDVIQNREAEIRGYRESLKYSQGEARRLRMLLALGHGCVGLYADDGELQCGSCRIDFLRDPTEVIERRIEERGRRQLAAAQAAQAGA